jgi:hypothetical protein
VDADDCARCPVREERSPRERILERLESAADGERIWESVARRIVAEELPE